MYIVVLNGPNLNMLGIRQPEIYGHETYEDLKAMIQQEADSLGVRVSFFQSNHEGALVDAIQQAYFDKADGIIINPGAYTHTSIALLDAVLLTTCLNNGVHAFSSLSNTRRSQAAKKAFQKPAPSGLPI